MKQFHNNKGQTIGWFKDGIYRKKVKDSCHRMKIFDAYGIESSVINEIKDKCTEIRILETEDAIIYSTTFENFLEHKIEKDFETLQMFLPVKYFTKKEI